MKGFLWGLGTPLHTEQGRTPSGPTAFCSEPVGPEAGHILESGQVRQQDLRETGDSGSEMQIKNLQRGGIT